MSDTDILSGFIEPALPGAWIAEHWRIWQMHFLTASKLSDFGRDRGLASFGENGVIQLWQLGLLKADRILSAKKLSQVGLVHRGNDKYGRHVYSDERQLPRHRTNWKNALKYLKPLRAEIELLFHPFRYYVLYHLNNELDVRISGMFMLSQDRLPRVLDLSSSFFNRWTNSEHFIANIRKWNDIASLVILTEPCQYVRIFGSLKYDPDEVTNLQDGAEEIHHHMNEYWEQYVEQLYQRIGLERLEKVRQDLCFDTEILEPNEWIHTLLCLGDSNLRIKLEGHLGGALFLRTMAEMLRRTTEKAFDTPLREEDEVGPGLMPRDLKKRLYGSNRLLDDQQAGGAFARKHGLNYKARSHLYCEGNTEYGAFNSFFKMMGIFVPITNLHGLFKLENEKYQMLTFFMDQLHADMKNEVYSLVLFDNDLEDNFKVIANQARINQTSPNEGMFGRFFAAEPDFELANFEIEELERILWNWVATYEQTTPRQEERDLLHSHVKGASGSTEFFNGVKSASMVLPQLTGYDKGEEWGEELMKFAWEYPLKGSRKRPLLEAAELLVYWETVIDLEPYERSKQSFMVDPKTGQLIKRPS